MTDMAEKTSQAPTPKDERQFVGPNTEMLLASQRRNVEAMICVSRATLDAAAQAWRLQLDFLEHAAGQLTNLADVLGPSNGIDRQLVMQACERNLAQARELSQLLTKTASEGMGVIGERLCDGFSEMRRAWKLNGKLR